MAADPTKDFHPVVDTSAKRSQARAAVAYRRSIVWRRSRPIGTFAPAPGNIADISMAVPPIHLT
jgi:hypothetical protein